VALFVAAPLGTGLVAARDRTADEAELRRLERERALAVQALRELEFDREMKKLSDADYAAMYQGLQNRALTAMTAIEKIRQKSRDEAQKLRDEEEKKAASVAAAARPSVGGVRMVMAASRRDAPTIFTPRPEVPPASGSRRVRFCPQCGTRAAPDSNFCAECGIGLKATARATNWNE
jgi:hypothetical protein